MVRCQLEEWDYFMGVLETRCDGLELGAILAARSFHEGTGDDGAEGVGRPRSPTRSI